VHRNALGKTFTGSFKLFGVNLNPAWRRPKWSWNRANGALGPWFQTSHL